MPKKLKLNLDELKIQSFITTLNDDERKNLKGGGSGGADCGSVPTYCSCGTNCDTVCGTCGSHNVLCC